MTVFKRMPWYAVGQAIGYGVDIGVFYILTTLLQLGRPVVSNVVGKLCAATFAFFFHARFSFPGVKEKSQASSALAYVVLLVGNLPLTS